MNPIPIYQQGFNLPGQPTYNYQPGVPLPANIQQVGAQQLGFQQPSLVPNIPGVPINIQQLTQTGSTSPIQPTNIQGIPFGSQQFVQSQTDPFRAQYNGYPINTVQQQATYPVNQQFIPQIVNNGAPGPVIFPQ